LRATRRALDRPVCMAASPLGAAAVRLRGPRDSRAPHPHRLRAAHAAAQRPELALRVPAGTVAPSPRRLVDWLARTGVRCVQIPAAVVTAAFVGRAHALGLHVHAWTVNDRPTMKRLLDLGVDGVMTDQTVALRDVLIARDQWHPRTVSAA